MKNLILLIAMLAATMCYAQDSTLVFSPKRPIKLEGGSNFRDLGGYPAAKGKTVKWGNIYRSADVSKLTDNDLKTLEELHLATVCDLRGPEELKSNPDRLPQNINYVNLPAGSENVRPNMNFTATNQDSLMASFYTRTDHLKAKYKPMFDQLLALPNGKALMFHCTAGKDRTGMGAAMVLSALGVNKQYIIADYAATNVFWKAREKMLQGMIKQGMSEKTASAMLSAKPLYIETFFKTIDEKYGSMDNFLKNEMELTPAKLKVLRNRYLQ